MSPTILHEIAILPRRLAGAMLDATLWAPVFAPVLMLLGNLVARLAGFQPFALREMLVVGFAGLFIGRAFSTLNRPLMFEVNEVAMDASLPIRAKLRTIWQLPLGRFLAIYAVVFIALVGLSSVI